MIAEERIIKSENELLKKLQEDIGSTSKENIKFFAGHLPLLYNDSGTSKTKTKKGYAEISTKRWGEFSTYSFDLGCKLAKYATEQGKNTGLLVVVDDMVEIPSKKGQLNKSVKEWEKRAQKDFYRENGFPEEYKKIAEKRGVEDKIIRQQRTFGNSKLISEYKLKTNALSQGRYAPNQCSLTYNSMIDNNDLFNKDKDYLISFVPGQCKGNLCEGVLNIRYDIDASHVFFPHIENMGGLVETPKGFLQITSPQKANDWYKENNVTYMKSKSI